MAHFLKKVLFLLPCNTCDVASKNRKQMVQGEPRGYQCPLTQVNDDCINQTFFRWSGLALLRTATCSSSTSWSSWREKAQSTSSKPSGPWSDSSLSCLNKRPLRCTTMSSGSSCFTSGIPKRRVRSWLARVWTPSGWQFILFRASCSKIWSKFWEKNRYLPISDVDLVKFG